MNAVVAERIMLSVCICCSSLGDCFCLLGRCCEASSVSTSHSPFFYGISLGIGITIGTFSQRNRRYRWFFSKSLMDSFQQAGFLSDRVITGLLVRPICSEAVDTPLQTVTSRSVLLVGVKRVRMGNEHGRTG